MSRGLLLWDFDGTLADTLRLALATYNRLAGEYGFRPVEDPLAVRDLGMADFLKTHHIPGWRVPGLFTQFLRSMSAHISSVSLFEGVADAVQQLRDEGWQQVVVSSNSTDNVRACLQDHGLAGVFESICGTSRLFGKERGIRRAIRDSGIHDRNCLYLGDEVRDVTSAEAAGIDVGGVAWGLNSADMLSRQNVVFVAEQPSQLPELIRSWGQTRSDA